MQKKTILAIGVSTLLFSVIAAGWLFWEYQRLFAEVTQDIKEKTTDYMLPLIEPVVRSGDFTTNDESRRSAALEKFATSIQTPDIVRIKIWDDNYTVIWSDLHETIGQRFTDNGEVTEALAGGTEVELVTGEESENVTERQFNYLAEIYVPIPDASGKIVGVFEVYEPASTIQEQLRTEFNLIILYTILAVIFGVALVALMAQRMKR